MRLQPSEQVIEEKKPQDYYFANDNDWSRISLDPGNFSTPQRYSGSSVLDFFLEDSRRAAESSEPTASVPIASSWRHALVILHQPNSTEEGVEEVPLKVSSQEWKELDEASLRLVNLTDSPLEIVFGETDVHLAPNQNYDVNLGDFEDLYVPIQMFDSDSGNQRLAYSKKLRINPEGRMLLMIRRELNKSNRLRVSTLSLEKDEP
jgi:hypothetical protein